MKVSLSPEILNLIENGKSRATNETLTKLWQEANEAIKEKKEEQRKKEVAQKALLEKNKRVSYSHD